MKELNMSEAKKLCIWHDFETKEEERAFMRGFESALEWINDEEVLGCSDKLEKELAEMRSANRTKSNSMPNPVKGLSLSLYSMKKEH